jgi:hypothetical protein
MSETTTVAEEPRDEIAADSDGGREISEPVTNSAAPDEGDDLPDYDFSDDGDLGDEEDDRDEPDPDETITATSTGSTLTSSASSIAWTAR